MFEWIIKHQRLFSLGMGSLLLIIALGLFFWTNESALSKEERLAQANIARMQARTEGANHTQSVHASATLDTFYEGRDKQMQYLLIIMIIGGIGFLGFGFFKKS
ncbi:MAG: hypothetical protein U9R50_00830 [Campylobacterota bacterium]|nr:hypothetical protein [Campylobacterota bacterium]